MGKSEESTASIGIKILLSDLILQMNEINFNIIKKMLCNGYIEDENEYYNEVYDEIVQRERGMNDVDCVKLKEYLMHEFKTRGSYYKSKHSSNIINDVSKGCLFDKTLLVPIKKILSMERWGYERYGINCMSRPLDFNLSINAEEYKEIKKFEIVFIIKQNSG